MTACTSSKKISQDSPAAISILQNGKHYPLTQPEQVIKIKRADLIFVFYASHIAPRTRAHAVRVNASLDRIAYDATRDEMHIDTEASYLSMDEHGLVIAISPMRPCYSMGKVITICFMKTMPAAGSI